MIGGGSRHVDDTWRVRIQLIEVDRVSAGGGQVYLAERSVAVMDDEIGEV